MSRSPESNPSSLNINHSESAVPDSQSNTLRPYIRPTDQQVDAALDAIGRNVAKMADERASKMLYEDPSVDSIVIGVIGDRPQDIETELPENTPIIIPPATY
jgi:hypothetical protein